MNNLIKKLEEQITFLQHEISQMSEELYLQQLEIENHRKEILQIKSKIISIEENTNKYDSKNDPLPPHY